MKVPVSWLREYVEFNDSIDGLVRRLTFSGIEVEGVQTLGAGLDQVINFSIRFDHT